MEENTDEKAARLEAYRQFAYTSPNMTLDDFKANVDQVSTIDEHYHANFDVMLFSGAVTHGYQARGDDRRWSLYCWKKELCKRCLEGGNIRAKQIILQYPGCSRRFPIFDKGSDVRRKGGRSGHGSSLYAAIAKYHHVSCYFEPRGLQYPIPVRVVQQAVTCYRVSF